MIAKAYISHVNVFATKSPSGLLAKLTILSLSLPFLLVLAWVIPALTLFVALLVPTGLVATMFFWAALPLGRINLGLGLLATIFVIVISIALYQPIIGVWSESWSMYWGVLGWPFSDYSDFKTFLGDFAFVSVIMIGLSVVLYFPLKFALKLFENMSKKLIRVRG